MRTLIYICIVAQCRDWSTNRTFFLDTLYVSVNSTNMIKKICMVCCMCVYICCIVCFPRAARVSTDEPTSVSFHLHPGSSPASHPLHLGSRRVRHSTTYSDLMGGNMLFYGRCNNHILYTSKSYSRVHRLGNKVVTLNMWPVTNDLVVTCWLPVSLNPRCSVQKGWQVFNVYSILQYSHHSNAFMPV